MSSFLALLKKVLRRDEELCFVFRVKSLDAETDRKLYSIALNLEKALRSRVESTLSNERVRLTRIEIRPGSVELRIIFLAAYEFVAKQEDLGRNSSQMVEKISTCVKAIFSEAGIHDLSFVSPLNEG